MGVGTADNEGIKHEETSQREEDGIDRSRTLFWTVVLYVVLGLGFAALATYLLWALLSGTWFPQLGGPFPPPQPSFFDVLKVGLTVVAGVGGVVALVVAYRKQALSERQEALALRQEALTKRAEARADREEDATQVLRFVERFGTAASQLGDQAPAVRLAGVYAMSSLADEYANQRQQCIDVMCAYLRLSFSPDPSDPQLTHHIAEQTMTDAGAITREQRSYNPPLNDQQVRATIVSVIRAHLHPGAPVSWSHNNFDFTGAALLDAQFDEATFSGEETWFNDASFSGEWTSFTGATFSGAQTSFDGATFSGRFTSFVGATFSEEWTSFSGTTFSGKYTSFGGATFSGAQTWFDGTRFFGEETSFRGTTFSGEWTSFHGARFSGMLTSFDEATFSGAQTRFDEATFSGKTTSFDNATFGTEPSSPTVTSFDEIALGDTTVIAMEGIHVFDGATITRDGDDFRGWPEPPAQHTSSSDLPGSSQ